MSNPDIARKLGRRIKALRKTQSPKLTQSGLAGKAATTHVFIAQIETGRKSPSLEMLGKIADALGVQIKDLFAFPAENASEETVMKETALREIQDVVNRSKLAPRELAMLREITMVVCGEHR